MCIIVALANSSFSIISGFATFSVLGNLAVTTGRTVEEVATRSGTGLAFISIAEGIGGFGYWANVMAVAFFVTLLALGLDSTFAWAETFIIYLDDLGRSLGKPQPRWKCVCRYP